MALGPGDFYRRFSLDACQPSGYGGEHAGARLGHGAGARARAVLWILALVGEIGGLVSPALFGLVAEHMAYSGSFAMFGLCSLATAALLAFSVRETVGSGKL